MEHLGRIIHITYMTNLVAEMAVTLALVTNWTGVNVGTNELGYIATNHAARIIYDGKTNVFQLQSTPSSIAVWRPLPKVIGFWTVTNYHWPKELYFTNAYQNTHPNWQFAH